MLTAVSSVDFILHQAETSLPDAIVLRLTTLLRFALGLRVLRFLSIGPLARVLLKLDAATPMVSNVMGVLVIVLYVYSIMGAQLLRPVDFCSSARARASLLTP